MILKTIWVPEPLLNYTFKIPTIDYSRETQNNTINNL